MEIRKYRRRRLKKIALDWKYPILNIQEIKKNLQPHTVKNVVYVSVNCMQTATKKTLTNQYITYKFREQTEKELEKIKHIVNEWMSGLEGWASKQRVEWRKKALGGKRVGGRNPFDFVNNDKGGITR